MKKRTEICDYCCKRFPIQDLSSIPEYNPRNQYCKRCYSVVYDAIQDFPWNRNKFFENKKNKPKG